MPRFHFALGHIDDSASLEVNLHEHAFELAAHTEDSLDEARKLHPVLSKVSEEIARRFTHFTDIPDEHIDGDAMRWVQVVRPQQPGSHLSEIVLINMIIPPDILRAFYKSPMWKERYTRRFGRHKSPAIPKEPAEMSPHSHGRLHTLGVRLHDVGEEEAITTLMAVQELVDVEASAVSFIGHHPDLATTQPVVKVYISEAHILPDPRVNPDQYNAMQALSKEMSKVQSWTPPADCVDKNGNPIKAEYDLDTFKTGQQLQTFKVVDNVMAAAPTAVAGAQRTSADDMQLQNQLWSPAPGTSVLKSAGKNGKTQQAEDLTEDKKFKWTVPYQTYTYGVKLDPQSLKINDQNDFSIDCYNIYSRTFWVAYELFDDKRKSLGARKSIDSLSAVDSILGIPIPIFPTTEKFNIGEASTVKIYFGSLGAANWDKVSWDDLNVSDRGALLTCAWQYGVPITFMIAGKILTSTETYNKIVKDKELRNAAIAILAFLATAGVASKSAVSNWKQTMLQFGSIVIGFVVQKGMESFGEWLVEQVGEGQLAKAFGPVGWLFQLAAAALSIEQMAITTGEVLASDSLVTAEITRAIDVNAVLHPDPRHGVVGHPETAVWASVAVKYTATLQMQSGTNFEIKGNMPQTTGGEPIPLTFKDIPAGGKFRIFFGIYSANDWLAGAWQSDWIEAKTTDGTSTLKLGDKNIKENLVPLGIDTQYVYKEKIVYGDSNFSWAVDKPPATTLSSLNCANNGGLCELTAMTINNSAFQVGFAWRAANQHLHPDSPSAPVSNNQLYSVQNLSVLAHPGSQLITAEIGLTQKPGIAYAPSTNSSEKAIDQNNFILDPRNGVMNLRKVTLEAGKETEKRDFGLGDTPLLSWGSFPLDNLDALAIHPSNAVLACSFSNHKLMILKLPASASPDGQAPEALMVSGEGIREGLMKGPKALAVAPDGRILILESLNNRVQAFDTLGNAVPSFTPDDFIFTVKTADVSADLDAGKVPAAFTDWLIDKGQNYLGPLPNMSYIAELDGGKFQPEKDPLIAAFAVLNVTLSYDPKRMDDPSVSSQIQIVKTGKSWIINDPRQQSWQIVNKNGMLNVYRRPAQISVEVQHPGNRWMLRDNSIGLAWILTVSSGHPDLVEIFDCFTYFNLRTGPDQTNLNYLDMAVEAQGYMYILSYIYDGAAATNYLLDVYNPDGTFLFRSPDATKSNVRQNIVAGRIAVDIWRNLYALNYEMIKGLNGGTQPGLAHWTPTPPLFSFPLTEQPNFNAQNISAVKVDFAAHNINLSNQAFIRVKNPDGYWEVKDENTIYHVYRTGEALQVYSIPA
ncbi:MAG TPA: hypothetical protein VF721_05570 [Pyrinomonadaceae bacterium]|jgi:hypothetical protein